jgi:hypothetical protein
VDEEGALCLSSSSSGHSVRHQVIPNESACHEDKHKAPTRPHIHPLSLQDTGDAGGRFQSLPYSVGKIHQDGGVGSRSLLHSVIKIHQANCHSPQYNSTLPKRTRSPILTPASSNALVTPIFERVTCRRSILSSLSWLVMLTVRSTRLPRTI